MFCTKCGTDLSDDSQFCRKCGQPQGSTGGAVSVATAVAQEREKVFYQGGDVTVTSSRFIVPGQTYAMSGVTSVRFERIDPKRGWPLFIVVVGLLLLVAPDTRGLAVFLLLVGMVWLAVLKTEYAVALRSSSGEVRAIKNTNSEFISGIIGALNEAIVYRR